jgi:hypothetical protein
MKTDAVFKQYGKFQIHGCLVEIREEASVVYYECQTRAKICAQYLFDEGFVDEDENIELVEL